MTYNLKEFPALVAGPTFIGFSSQQNVAYPGDNTSFTLYSLSSSSQPVVIARGTGLVDVTCSSGDKTVWMLIPQQPLPISLSKYTAGGVFLQINYKQSGPCSAGFPLGYCPSGQNCYNGVCGVPSTPGIPVPPSSYSTNELQFFNGDAQWM